MYDVRNRQIKQHNEGSPRRRSGQKETEGNQESRKRLVILFVGRTGNHEILVRV
jgi:hypothetical protein